METVAFSPGGHFADEGVVRQRGDVVERAGVGIGGRSLGVWCPGSIVFGVKIGARFPWGFSRKIPVCSGRMRVASVTRLVQCFLCRNGSFGS